MQKLWLKDFDQRIAANMSNAAWDMFNAGKVRQLREVEKHFWVAHVEPDLGLSFEVETIITPHKISGYTCDCWQEGRRLMCVHVAATLLAVRQFLEQKRLEKERIEEKQDTVVAGRFTVTSVLSSVEPEHLLEFVRDYARRDKDFALALKTWFAAREDDSDTHFLQLLDSVLPKNLEKKALPEKDFRRLRLVLEDLTKQIETNLAAGNAFAAFNLAIALLSKSKFLLENVGETRGEILLPLAEKSWQAIIQLNWEHLSPELRERVWQFFYESAENQRFPKPLERPLLGWVAARTEHFDKIHAIFHRSKPPVSAHILVLYLAALANRGMERAGVRVLEDYGSEPDTIWHCLIELYYLNLSVAFVFLGEYFLEKDTFNSIRQRELEEMLLQSAEKLKDKKLTIKYLRKKFVRNGSFDVLNKIKLVAGEKSWEKEMQFLLKTLKLRGDLQKMGAVLTNFGSLDQLANFLEQEKNVLLLQKFESKLLADRPEWIENLYFDLLKKYLDEHFGRPANEFVREILSSLIQKGEQKMAVRLIQKLKTNFNERQSLAEDLLQLFPKHRRRELFAGLV